MTFFHFSINVTITDEGIMNLINLNELNITGNNEITDFGIVSLVLK